MSDLRYYIIANMRMSRRLFINQIVDPTGPIVRTEQDLGACLTWLYEQGQRHVNVFRVERDPSRMVRIQLELHDCLGMSAKLLVDPLADIPA